MEQDLLAGVAWLDVMPLRNPGFRRREPLMPAGAAARSFRTVRAPDDRHPRWVVRPDPPWSPAGGAGRRPRRWGWANSASSRRGSSRSRSGGHAAPPRRGQRWWSGDRGGAGPAARAGRAGPPGALVTVDTLRALRARAGRRVCAPGGRRCRRAISPPGTRRPSCPGWRASWPSRGRRAGAGVAAGHRVHHGARGRDPFHGDPRTCAPPADRFAIGCPTRWRSTSPRTGCTGTEQDDQAADCGGLRHAPRA